MRSRCNPWCNFAIFFVMYLLQAESVVYSYEQKVDVSVALDKCRNSLVRLATLDCEAIEERKSGRVSAFRFLQDRDLYRIDRRDRGAFTVRGESFSPVVGSVAFNGLKYQHLSDGVLSISDRRSPVRLGIPPHFQAFEWIGVGYGALRDQLLDEEVWNEVRTRCRNEIEIEKLENEECAVLKIRPRSGKDGECKVYLDTTKAFFPVGFEGVIEGKPTRTCRVREMHTVQFGGESIFFPVLLESVEYNPDGSVYDKVVCKVGLSSLLINRKVDQSRFTIVPFDPKTEIADQSQIAASIQRIPKSVTFSGSRIVVGLVIALLVFLVFFARMRSNAKV